MTYVFSATNAAVTIAWIILTGYLVTINEHPWAIASFIATLVFYRPTYPFNKKERVV